MLVVKHAHAATDLHMETYAAAQAHVYVYERRQSHDCGYAHHALRQQV